MYKTVSRSILKSSIATNLHARLHEPAAENNIGSAYISAAN